MHNEARRAKSANADADAALLMFVLLAGRGAGACEDVIARMAAELRGGSGSARHWRSEGRDAAAASVPPDFLPEDRFDRQPLAGEDRALVCQARLDNRDELLEGLGLAADSPLADSALLAAAYDRWGEGCLDRIAGDFAFAAWHRGSGRIFAAVDPLGAKRLLWTRIGSGLALSPQLPALLAHPAVSREPDLDAIAALLDFGIDRATTAYAAIRSLPGGHRLRWTGGELQVERWWQPEFRPGIWHRDRRDYVEETGELLERAVRAQLRSRDPISSTLSGGLDSGCVTALAARMLAPAGVRLAAYTSVPEEGLAPSQRPGWEPDDRRYAAEVAACYPNIDHRLVAPEGRCSLDAAEAVHRRSLTPSKGATNLLWLDRIGGAMHAAGSRVLLLGQVGNGGFSWRGQSTVVELAGLGRIRASLAQARLEAKGRQRSLAWVLAGAARDFARSRRRRSLGETLRNPASRFASPSRRIEPGRQHNEYALVPGTRAFWAASVTTPKHVWWPEPALQWGVEYRDPTADRRLLERLLRYPQFAFRAEGRPRGLAREAARGLLPDSVRLRRTQGAQVPEAPSLIAAHRARYRSALESFRASSGCREVLDLDELDRGLAGFEAGGRDYYAALALDRAFGIGMFLAGLEGKA